MTYSHEHSNKRWKITRTKRRTVVLATYKSQLSRLVETRLVGNQQVSPSCVRLSAYRLACTDRHYSCTVAWDDRGWYFSVYFCSLFASSALYNWAHILRTWSPYCKCVLFYLGDKPPTTVKRSAILPSASSEFYLLSYGSERVNLLATCSYYIFTSMWHVIAPLLTLRAVTNECTIYTNASSCNCMYCHRKTFVAFKKCLEVGLLLLACVTVRFFPGVLNTIQSTIPWKLIEWQWL